MRKYNNDGEDFFLKLGTNIFEQHSEIINIAFAGGVLISQYSTLEAIMAKLLIDLYRQDEDMLNRYIDDNFSEKEIQKSLKDFCCKNFTPPENQVMEITWDGFKKIRHVRASLAHSLWAKSENHPNDMILLEKIDFLKSNSMSTKVLNSHSPQYSDMIAVQQHLYNSANLINRQEIEHLIDLCGQIQALIINLSIYFIASDTKERQNAINVFRTCYLTRHIIW